MTLARIARAAFVGIVSLWAAYVVAGNAVLWTGLLRGVIDADERSLRVDWAHAWTVVPGRITVEGFSMRFQDSNVQFSLGIDRATLQIDPVALTQRTFHVTRLVARGATFRARHKIDRASDAGPREAAFGPIDGFADPPVRSPKPTAPARPDAQDDLWTIALDDVSASVRELWIQEYRYRGPMSVAGGFRLVPKRELELEPSVMLARGGSVSIGGGDVLVKAGATVEARAARFDVSVPKGLEILRAFDAKVDLEGRIPSLAPAGAVYLARGGGASLEGGEGSLAVHARMTRGALEAGSRVELRSDDVALESPRFSLRGAISAEARVEQGRARRSLAARVDLDRASARVSDERASGLWLHARLTGGVVASLSSPSFDAAIALRAGPGDRVLHVAAEPAGLPGFLADAMAGDAARAKAKVHAGGGGLSLAPLDVEDGSVGARGSIARQNGRLTGALVVSAGPLRARVEIADGRARAISAGAGGAARGD